MLLRPVAAAGGEIRLSASVERIVADRGGVRGVEFAHDGARCSESSAHVISAMSVLNTIACLAPDVASDWQQTVGGLHPGLSYVSLYVGFAGDIARAGASSANYWIYTSEDVGAVWRRPADEPAPGLFVSFPSLKDPSGQTAPTAEILAILDAEVFAPWLALPDQERPEEYRALKAWIEENLLAQFLDHFPALRPLVRYHELSTPLSQQRYTRSPAGAMYGIEMTGHRLTSDALRIRTPVKGLFLAGQDVTSPGIPPACLSGLLAAAQIDSRVWSAFRA
jgi:all-trans-retinol 13,14-reductase